MIYHLAHNTKKFDSYRASRVKSMFNAENGHEWKKEVKIDIPEDWQIGLVVGKSGSGKTTLGRALLGSDNVRDLYNGWDNNRPIIDDILPSGSFNDVTSALAGVGLGDVPSWLRPFNALSNGQQYRAGLARVLCEQPEKVVIDEFTSVVDRQIARIGALAFGKSWRRTKGKKAVLLSCHYDVIEWLQPDWVFDLDTGELKKKVKLGTGQNLSSKFGRSTEVTGKALKSIII